MAALPISSTEPSIEELLDDPIFKLIQESDQVTPQDIPCLMLVKGGEVGTPVPSR